VLRLLLSLIRPLSHIAQELRILRELYELDLQSRVPPIYRMTEKPSKADTEVSYQGVDEKTPFWKRVPWFNDEEDKDDAS